MATTVNGVVKKGIVVPDSALPEGARVEIRLIESPLEVDAELQAEFEAWDQASAKALELVERLAEEGDGNETR